MHRTSVNVVAPRWRHFIPEAESMIIPIPAYVSVRDASGKVSTIKTLDMNVDVTENYVSEGKQFVIPLPESYVVTDSTAITLLFNGVVQDNGNDILYYIPTPQVQVPVYGPRWYKYNSETHSIEFQFLPDWNVNRAPALGTKIELKFVDSSDETQNPYTRIDMSKWLIQGANPIDPSIVKPDGTGTNQFQGGYRCTIKLISQAAHGSVRISDDKSALEYRADMGYAGNDSFAYRMVNALGQESPAYCVRVQVGTNATQTGA